MIFVDSTSLDEEYALDCARWILGLLCPWLAETIQRPYKRSELKRGFQLELKDLKNQVDRSCCAGIALEELSTRRYSMGAKDDGNRSSGKQTYTNSRVGLGLKMVSARPV